MAYGIPISQLVFGTVSSFPLYHGLNSHLHPLHHSQDADSLMQDYPYGIGFWDVKANIAGLADANFLTEEEKKSVFYNNSKELWKGKIEDF